VPLFIVFCYTNIFCLTCKVISKQNRMKPLNVILICLFLLCFGPIYSQKTKVDTVKIGAFISSLNDFDIGNNTINADIHLWCIYNDSNYNFEKEIEFINCNDFSYNGTSSEKIENQYWFYTKALIKSRQKFSTKKYPFDTQKVIFSIESSEYTTDDFVFKPDISGSKLDSIVYSQFDDWVIDNVSFTSTSTLYKTSFGDPTTSNSSSPRFDIAISISRTGSWLILFKLITGIIVAFLISSCVFWIKPINTDPRFGLCVGGLFAAIGNKYIVESIIPTTNELTLLDYLHNITFIFIFLIIIISVISLRLFEQENEKLKKISEKIDFISYFLITIMYFTFISYYIFIFSK
jgi:hypothetical protein